MEQDMQDMGCQRAASSIPADVDTDRPSPPPRAPPSLPGAVAGAGSGWGLQVSLICRYQQGQVCSALLQCQTQQHTPRACSKQTVWGRFVLNQTQKPEISGSILSFARKLQLLRITRKAKKKLYLVPKLH